MAAVRTGIAVAQGRLGEAERLAADAESAARRAETVGEMGLLWPRSRTLGRCWATRSAPSRRSTIGSARTPGGRSRFRELVEAFAGPSRGGRAANAHPASAPMTRSGAPLDLISLGSRGPTWSSPTRSGSPASRRTPRVTRRGLRARGPLLGRLVHVRAPPRRRRVPARGRSRRGGGMVAPRADDAERAGAAGELARARYDLARTLIAAGIGRSDRPARDRDHRVRATGIPALALAAARQARRQAPSRSARRRAADAGDPHHRPRGLHAAQPAPR